MEFYRTEIEPIIKMLPDKQLSNSFRQSLKKYLIISLISSLEHFFRNEAKSIVDKNNLDITELFSGEKISFSVSELNKILNDRILTKGNIVISSFDFGNLDQANDVFSKLLNLDFLDYVHKLNDIDQTRQVLDGHPIPIEYRKIKEAYHIRNEIVHELKNPMIPNWRVLSLWDNIINIIEISVSVFSSASDPNLRSKLESDYQLGIEREKKKKMYKSYSERIIRYLSGRGQAQLLKDGKLYDVFIKDIEISSTDDILIDNIQWILRRMFRQKLIRRSGDNILLTDKGIQKIKKL